MFEEAQLPQGACIILSIKGGLQPRFDFPFQAFGITRTAQSLDVQQVFQMLGVSLQPFTQGLGTAEQSGQHAAGIGCGAFQQGRGAGLGEGRVIPLGPFGDGCLFECSGPRCAAHGNY